MYVVGIKIYVAEAILMSTHNIRFHEELIKIIIKYPRYLFHWLVYWIVTDSCIQGYYQIQRELQNRTVLKIEVMKLFSDKKYNV